MITDDSQDDSNVLPDDDTSDGEGFLQALEDSWSAIWGMGPMLIAETDPFSAFTMGDGMEPANAPMVQGGGMLTSTLSTVKDDALEAVGIDPSTPPWVYAVILIIVLFLVAYTVREVAG